MGKHRECIPPLKACVKPCAQAQAVMPAPIFCKQSLHTWACCPHATQLGAQMLHSIPAVVRIHTHEELPAIFKGLAARDAVICKSGEGHLKAIRRPDVMAQSLANHITHMQRTGSAATGHEYDNSIARSCALCRVQSLSDLPRRLPSLPRLPKCAISLDLACTISAKSFQTYVWQIVCTSLFQGLIRGSTDLCKQHALFERFSDLKCVHDSPIFSASWLTHIMLHLASCQQVAAHWPKLALKYSAAHEYTAMLMNLAMQSLHVHITKRILPITTNYGRPDIVPLTNADSMSLSWQGLPQWLKYLAFFIQNPILILSHGFTAPKALICSYRSSLADHGGCAGHAADSAPGHPQDEVQHSLVADAVDCKGLLGVQLLPAVEKALLVHRDPFVALVAVHQIFECCERVNAEGFGLPIRVKMNMV